MTKSVRTNIGKIYCDQNDGMTDRRYMPTIGTRDDLAALGLTLETAVGLPFELYMPDGDLDGNLGDIVGNGTVVVDAEFGFLLEVDENGFDWRPMN